MVTDPHQPHAANLTRRRGQRRDNSSFTPHLAPRVVWIGLFGSCCSSAGAMPALPKRAQISAERSKPERERANDPGADPWHAVADRRRLLRVSHGPLTDSARHCAPAMSRTIDPPTAGRLTSGTPNVMSAGQQGGNPDAVTPKPRTPTCKAPTEATAKSRRALRIGAHMDPTSRCNADSTCCYVQEDVEPASGKWPTPGARAPGDAIGLSRSPRRQPTCYCQPDMRIRRPSRDGTAVA